MREKDMSVVLIIETEPQTSGREWLAWETGDVQIRALKGCVIPFRHVLAECCWTVIGQYRCLRRGANFRRRTMFDSSPH